MCLARVVFAHADETVQLRMAEVELDTSVHELKRRAQCEVREWLLELVSFLYQS